VYNPLFLGDPLTRNCRSVPVAMRKGRWWLPHEFLSEQDILVDAVRLPPDLVFQWGLYS